MYVMIVNTCGVTDVTVKSVVNPDTPQLSEIIAEGLKLLSNIPNYILIL